MRGPRINRRFEFEPGLCRLIDLVHSPNRRMPSTVPHLISHPRHFLQNELSEADVELS